MSFGKKLLSLQKKGVVFVWILAVVVCAGLLVISANEETTAPPRQTVESRGAVLYVAPTGDDANSGKDKDAPLASIQLALERAQPGDKIELADGAYYQSIRSVRSGTPADPITLTGGKDAVLYGSESRVVEISHSYLVLDGFQVNGQWADGDSKDDFRDKLIYVIGTEPKKGVEGLKLTNLLIQNAGGECVRLRYFAKNNEVSHSTIRNCGIYDYRFNDGGKNGEGVYIGTAPEQLADGKNPTLDPDESSGNQILRNTIETNGNECVDIKEASFNNVVEHNMCSNQLDPESGGFDSRGNSNIFRFNTVKDTQGAAVRLGGDGDEDGISNSVYENSFINNARGALNIQRKPQDKICGNTTDYNDDRGSDNGDIDPTRPCN